MTRDRKYFFTECCIVFTCFLTFSIFVWYASEPLLYCTERPFFSDVYIEIQDVPAVRDVYSKANRCISEDCQYKESDCRCY